MFYIIVGVYFIFFSVSNAIAAHFEAVKAYVEERVATGNIGQNINRHKYAFGYILVSIFLCLFVGGAIFQSLEGWSFVEGLYFAVETSTTVGYGDLDINNEPSTYLFVIFYIVFSTVLFAFAFNTFNLIQEELKQMEKEEEILARKQEMGFIADLDKGNGVTEGQFILAALEHLGTLNFEKDVKPSQEKFRELDIQGVGKVNHQALESLSHRESIAASDRISRIHNLQNSNQSGISSLFRPSVMTMSNAIAAHFEAVKAYVEERVATGNIGQNINRHKYAFGYILVSIFLCLFVGGAIFQSLEGWSFVEGLYFAVETSTTVGYGDLDINNEPSTYLFVIFYIVFSTVLFAFAFNTFNLIQEELKQMEKEEEILARKQEMGFIADLDKGNGVTEGQFILAVLEHLGTLNYEKDVKPWQEKFRELDIQGVGKVNHQIRQRRQ
eukprot:gene8674-6238_t